MSYAACQSCNRHYIVGDEPLDDLYCPECKEEVLKEWE
jgi:RNA polymerase subunit RPABC4/transcription elongation factor Spt4